VLVLTPGWKRRFDEFGLQLPWLTKQVIGLANLAWDNWWLAVPLALVGALAWGGIVGWLRHARGWATAVTVAAALMLAALVAANLVVAYGLILPEIKLQEALSK
jgi:type II secretory pathway component PulF